MMSKSKNFFCIITILILFLSTKNIYAYSSAYVWSDNTKIVETNVNLNTKANLVQTSANTEGNFLNLSSGAAILIDQNSGAILYEHNSHEKLRPASVTKLMTILLIMESLENGTLTYDTKVSCSTNAREMGGSQIWLDEREELTVDEMLKAICVVSANDCTVAMAEYLAGSEEAFVQKMNEKAAALEMKDTTFKNSHGIDEDGHVTSAYDIALMSRELLLNHPEITKYTTIYMDTLRDGKSQLVNTNKLIRTYNGATGLKTGSTSLALYNLSSSATRDGLNLISVIMKADTSAIRFEEAKKLLDYGYNTYIYKEFGTANEIVNEVSVQKGVLDKVNAIFETVSGSLIKKGSEDKLEQTITLETALVAPIDKGQKIGEVVYTIDDKIVGKTNIIAEEEVKKLNLLNTFTYTFQELFCLQR